MYTLKIPGDEITPHLLVENLSSKEMETSTLIWIIVGIIVLIVVIVSVILLVRGLARRGDAATGTLDNTGTGTGTGTLGTDNIRPNVTQPTFRYVRIRKDLGGIHSGEIEVLKNNVNVARLPGVTTISSSNYNDYYSVGNLVDGQPNPPFVSQGNPNEFGLIDLGQNYTAPVTVIVRNRADACAIDPPRTCAGYIVGSEIQLLDVNRNVVASRTISDIQPSYTFQFNTLQ